MSIERLGKLGERIVKEYFEMQNCKVEMSEDPFDMSKDMMIDGKHTEVKFQTIYYHFKVPNMETYEAFTVPITTTKGGAVSNQLDKCLNADRWIIVQNPRPGSKLVTLWEAPPPGQRRFRVIQNKRDNRHTAGFALETFNKIIDINNEPLYNRIKEIDKSNYKRTFA
jgi:hypothetical protein